jgi:hypothetical protein
MWANNTTLYFRHYLITYPTGGSTTFIYEGNRYGQNFLGGGLRIKQVINNDGNGKNEYKTYQYRSGIMPDYLQPKTSLFSIKEMKGVAWQNSSLAPTWSLINKIYNCEIPSVFFDYSSSFVDYPNVREYQGTIENNTGYTEFNYESQWDDDLIFPSYQITTNNIERYEGVIEYYLNNPQPWYGGKIRRKTVRSNDFGTEETYYYYSCLYYDTIYTLNTCCRISIVGPNDVDKNSFEYRMTYHDDDYLYNNKSLISGVELLTKEVTQKDGVIQTCNYIYNSENLLEKERTFQNSDGKNVRITQSHPSDYNYSPYIEMKNSNIVTPVIEKKSYVNSIQIYYTKTAYGLWNNGLHFLPESMYYQSFGQDSPEERIHYHSYDEKGNPLYIEKDE